MSTTKDYHEQGTTNKTNVIVHIGPQQVATANAASQAKYIKAELEDLRLKKLAKNMSHTFSNLEFGEVTNVDEFFNNQKKLEQQMRQKQLESLAALHRYRDGRKRKKALMLNSPTKYTTVTEMIDFFQQWDDMDAEWRNAQHTKWMHRIQKESNHDDCENSKVSLYDHLRTRHSFETLLTMQATLVKTLDEAKLVPLPDDQDPGTVDDIFHAFQQEMTLLTGIPIPPHYSGNTESSQLAYDTTKMNQLTTNSDFFVDIDHSLLETPISSNRKVMTIDDSEQVSDRCKSYIPLPFFTSHFPERTFDDSASMMTTESNDQVARALALLSDDYSVQTSNTHARDVNRALTMCSSSDAVKRALALCGDDASSAATLDVHRAFARLSLNDDDYTINTSAESSMIGDTLLDFDNFDLVKDGTSWKSSMFSPLEAEMLDCAHATLASPIQNTNGDVSNCYPSLVSYMPPARSVKRGNVEFETSCDESNTSFVSEIDQTAIQITDTNRSHNVKDDFQHIGKGLYHQEETLPVLSPASPDSVSIYFHIDTQKSTRDIISVHHFQHTTPVENELDDGARPEHTVCPLPHIVKEENITSMENVQVLDYIESSKASEKATALKLQESQVNDCICSSDTMAGSSLSTVTPATVDPVPVIPDYNKIPTAHSGLDEVLTIESSVDQIIATDFNLSESHEDLALQTDYVHAMAVERPMEANTSVAIEESSTDQTTTDVRNHAMLPMTLVSVESLNEPGSQLSRQVNQSANVDLIGISNPRSDTVVHAVTIDPGSDTMSSAVNSIESVHGESRARVYTDIASPDSSKSSRNSNPPQESICVNSFAALKSSPCDTSDKCAASVQISAEVGLISSPNNTLVTRDQSDLLILTRTLDEPVITTSSIDNTVSIDIKKIKDVVISEKSVDPVIAADDLHPSECLEHSMLYPDSDDALSGENPVEANITLNVEEYTADQTTTGILYHAEQLTTLDLVTAQGMILDRQVNDHAIEDRSGMSNPSSDTVRITDSVNKITSYRDQTFEPELSSSLKVLDHVESSALKEQNQREEFQSNLCHDSPATFDTPNAYTDQSQVLSIADIPTSKSSNEVAVVVEKGADLHDTASYISTGIKMNNTGHGARAIDVVEDVEQGLILNHNNENSNVNGRYCADTNLTISHLDTLSSCSESVIQAETDQYGNPEVNPVYFKSPNIVKTDHPTPSLSPCSENLKSLITTNFEKLYLVELDNPVFDSVCDSLDNVTSSGKLTYDVIPIDSVTFLLDDSCEHEKCNITEEVCMSPENSFARGDSTTVSGDLSPFITSVPLVSTEPWPYQGDHDEVHLADGNNAEVNEYHEDVIVIADEIDKQAKEYSTDITLSQNVSGLDEAENDSKPEHCGDIESIVNDDAEGGLGPKTPNRFHFYTPELDQAATSMLFTQTRMDVDQISRKEHIQAFGKGHDEAFGCKEEQLDGVDRTCTADMSDVIGTFEKNDQDEISNKSQVEDEAGESAGATSPNIDSASMMSPNIDQACTSVQVEVEAGSHDLTVLTKEVHGASHDFENDDETPSSLASIDQKGAEKSKTKSTTPIIGSTSPESNKVPPAEAEYDFTNCGCGFLLGFLFRGDKS